MVVMGRGFSGSRNINVRRTYFALGFLAFVLLYHRYVQPLPIERLELPTIKSSLSPQRPRPPAKYNPAACEIWPGAQQRIPPRASAADDAALPSLRVGNTEVWEESPGETCVPASSRLGPFGHSSGAEELDIPWKSVQWGRLQSRCAAAHYPPDDVLDLDAPYWTLRRPPEGVEEELHDTQRDNHRTGRTAIVFRTWDHFDHYDNQLAWMRALISETALNTGGRFQVFIMVHVKEDVDLFDEETYQDVINWVLPEELRDAALLFNEALLQEWYPKIDEHGAQDQMYQALQVFSYSFPQFDHVWQFEMDVRFTGNVADMLSTAAAWAQKQPRKNLWERNGQWYIPGMWNNNYTAFSENVDLQFSRSQGIWGPHPHAGFFVNPQGPSPPLKIDSRWGVGEEADLITFAPMIDPVYTSWTYEHAVHGFDSAWHMPRRMAIVSMTRTSRRLLRLISAEQRTSGAWVVSESTPETWSYLHGLKGVYVPHLVTFNLDEDDGTSPSDLDEKINKGPPWSRAGGDHASSVWCDDIGVPEDRWQRSTYFFQTGDAPERWWDYTNGTCTYPLLLHPVKED